MPSNKDNNMSVPFVLHSNLGDKERVAKRKEDLDKLTEEDWAELKRRNVHVYILGISGESERQIVHPTIDEIEAQIRKSLEDGTPKETILPDDLIPFT